MNFFYTEITEISKPILKDYYLAYTFFEYTTFALILYFSIENKKFRRLNIYLSVIYLIFLVTYYLTTHIKRLDTIPIGVETILIFIFIFYYFFQYFKNVNDSTGYNNPLFWIIVGILVYLGSTFFFNILADSVNREQIHNYWYFTYIGDILKNILLSIGVILYAFKPPKPSSSSQSSIPYLDII